MLDLGTDRMTDDPASPKGIADHHGMQADPEAGSTGDQAEHGGDSPWAHHMPKDSVWSGWQGLAIMIFGVILPSLMIVSGLVACYDRVVLLLWKQPVETVAEIVLLLAIPLANFTIWTALCKSDWRHTIRRGIYNGVSIGASAVIALITGIAAVLRFPTVSESGVSHETAFAIISALSILAMSIGVCLAAKVRETRITRNSKTRAVGYVAFGVLISIFAFVAAEAKSTCIRVAEYFATSDTFDER